MIPNSQLLSAYFQFVFICLSSISHCPSTYQSFDPTPITSSPSPSPPPLLPPIYQSRHPSILLFSLSIGQNSISISGINIRQFKGAKRPLQITFFCSSVCSWKIVELFIGALVLVLYKYSIKHIFSVTILTNLFQALILTITPVRLSVFLFGFG